MYSTFASNTRTGLTKIENRKDQSIEYFLYEDHELIKKFSNEEAELIMSGELDYTQFFKQEESKEKLEKAIRGRAKTLGFTAPEDFDDRVKEFR